jgi:hypothetical protein
MAEPAYSARKRGRILTYEEVCDLLSISPFQLKRAIQTRRIPVIRQPFGIRVTRFFEEDIRAGLEQFRRGSFDEEPPAQRSRSKRGARR